MTTPAKKRPAGVKAPQDRKPKTVKLPEDGHTYFTYEGETYRSTAAIQDVITFDLMEKILDYGESPMVSVAALRALYAGDPAVMALLRPLRFDSDAFLSITEQVFDRLNAGFGATVGESSGSSTSSEDTGGPSNTSASESESDSDG